MPVLVVAIGLAICTAAVAQAASASGMTSDDLSCTVSSNCVTTVGNNAMPPLRFAGTVDEGLAQLTSTLSTFPDATITRTQDHLVEAVFTTRIGFKDTVLFRVNGAEKKIDFRSRSNFGLFDFGKNGSRMTEFSARFEQQSRDGSAKK